MGVRTCIVVSWSFKALDIMRDLKFLTVCNSIFSKSDLFLGQLMSSTFLI